MKHKTLVAFGFGAILLITTSSARAGLVQVDLSPYVNLGFQNSWFINGAEFAPIIGSTFGNQGSAIPFTVANAADSSGQGGSNNFWFGLWGGPGNQLFGAPLSVTIPVNQTATTVYTLIDNTFGTEGNTEFSVTFTPTVGLPITEQYVGGTNTKDYNLNCGTTGCDTTPGAQYWFIDGGGTQWLQVVGWVLPADFGTLDSVTFNQENTVDGAILAGLTVDTGAQSVPEPGAFSLLGIGLASLLAMARRPRKLQ